MKSAGKARSNGLYRHIRTSKEIIRNLLNDLYKYSYSQSCRQKLSLNEQSSVTARSFVHFYIFFSAALSIKAFCTSVYLNLLTGIFIPPLKRI